MSKSAIVHLTNAFSPKSQTYVEVSVVRLACTINGKSSVGYAIRSHLLTWGQWTASHDGLQTWLEANEETTQVSPENLRRLEAKVRAMTRAMTEHGLKAPWNVGADAMLLRRQKFGVAI